MKREKTPPCAFQPTTHGPALATWNPKEKAGFNDWQKVQGIDFNDPEKAFRLLKQKEEKNGIHPSMPLVSTFKNFLEANEALLSEYSSVVSRIKSTNGIFRLQKITKCTFWLFHLNPLAFEHWTDTLKSFIEEILTERFLYETGDPKSEISKSNRRGGPVKELMSFSEFFYVFVSQRHKGIVQGEQVPF